MKSSAGHCPALSTQINNNNNNNRISIPPSVVTSEAVKAPVRLSRVAAENSNPRLTNWYNLSH